jgi:hypothetical protein
LSLVNDFSWEARDGQLAASKMPSHGNTKYFPNQSHNCWHRTAGFQIKKKPKNKNVIARCLQGSRSITIESYGCNSVVQTLQDCTTYIFKPSRTSLMMLAAPVRISCAFTAHYRSMMVTKILQAAQTMQDACTRLAPYPHDVTSTLAISKKCLTLR